MVDGQSGSRVALPFELDGGYVAGLDLSQRDRFDIEESQAKRPRLILEIATYNGVPDVLPADGFGLGVKSHRIAVSFDEGVKVENLGWRCARAMTVIQRRLWLAWEGLASDCELDEVVEALDAVPATGQPSMIGAMRQPVMMHRAEQVGDGSHVVIYTESRSSASKDAPPSTSPPRVLRLDLLSPALAAESMALLSGSAPEVNGVWRYWRNGLAVAFLRKHTAPIALTLVAAGEIRTFLRELASP